MPARFVPDPGDLRITLRHNGSVMQDETTADMIFDVERLLAYAHEHVRLLLGDLLLLTGSPAENALPPDGDVAPGLDVLGPAARAAVDGRHAAALVPRFAA